MQAQCKPIKSVTKKKKKKKLCHPYIRKRLDDVHFIITFIYLSFHFDKYKFM